MKKDTMAQVNGIHKGKRYFTNLCFHISKWATHIYDTIDSTMLEITTAKIVYNSLLINNNNNNTICTRVRKPSFFFNNTAEMQVIKYIHIFAIVFDSIHSILVSIYISFPRS